MCNKCLFNPSPVKIADEEGYVYHVGKEIYNYVKAKYEPHSLDFFNQVGAELDLWKVNPLANVNQRFKRIGHVNTIRNSR
jgi:hypothetical protein